MGRTRSENLLDDSRCGNLLLAFQRVPELPRGLVVDYKEIPEFRGGIHGALGDAEATG